MPDVLVLSTRCRLVPRFVMVTVAPDTTAFVESDTAPVISAVGVCAETAKESANRAKTLFTCVYLQAPGLRAGPSQSGTHYIGTAQKVVSTRMTHVQNSESYV